jgi:hypothetical protein
LAIRTPIGTCLDVESDLKRSLSEIMCREPAKTIQVPLARVRAPLGSSGVSACLAATRAFSRKDESSRNAQRVDILVIRRLVRLLRRLRGGYAVFSRFLL